MVFVFILENESGFFFFFLAAATLLNCYEYVNFDRKSALLEKERLLPLAPFHYRRIAHKVIYFMVTYYLMNSHMQKCSSFACKAKKCAVL